MKKKYNLFIPCDEAQHCCDKSQYKEANFLEKIKLSIHIIYCKACRNYSKNNSKLTKLMNNKSQMHAMEYSEKKNLEALFQKELSKNE